ncbi:MAG: hypothetical protein K5751_08225 [Treponemataceae bacterium]|nr:hypothetical protein [Treponemataceae bacterium]
MNNNFCGGNSQNCEKSRYIMISSRCANNFHSVAYFVSAFFRKAVSAAFFPDTCILCGTASYGIPLCRTCVNSLSKEASDAPVSAHCVICGKPILSEIEICMQCRTEKVPARNLDGICSVFPYLLNKKQLLYEWKIAGRKSLTPFFAECMEKLYAYNFKGLPIVPVPPRPGKIHKKGWDQTDSLASVFKRKYGVEVLKYLERTSMVQQKKLGRTERLSRNSQYKASKILVRAAQYKENRVTKNDYIYGRKNVSFCEENHLPSHVVLLDDVMTTGSTLSSCAAVLKSYGIEKVSALTLFTVPA